MARELWSSKQVVVNQPTTEQCVCVRVIIFIYLNIFLSDIYRKLTHTKMRQSTNRMESNIVELSSAYEKKTETETIDKLQIDGRTKTEYTSCGNVRSCNFMVFMEITFHFCCCDQRWVPTSNLVWCVAYLCGCCFISLALQSLLLPYFLCQ